MNSLIKEECEKEKMTLDEVISLLLKIIIIIIKKSRNILWNYSSLDLPEFPYKLLHLVYCLISSLLFLSVFTGKLNMFVFIRN